jgi:hypothetical protein
MDKRSIQTALVEEIAAFLICKLLMLVKSNTFPLSAIFSPATISFIANQQRNTEISIFL